MSFLCDPLAPGSWLQNDGPVAVCQPHSALLAPTQGTRRTDYRTPKTEYWLLNTEYCSPPSVIQATALSPRNVTLFCLLLPRATGCRSLNSVNGSSTLRMICQTPLESRSHKVIALRSASSRKREATALVPLRSGAAPI